MKTLIFSRDGSIRVLADSAVGRNRQPWFLPDFGSDWVAHISPSIRISRLGKGIRYEFADRYVEERSFAWIPRAVDNPGADFMDGAIVMGEWMPLGDSGLSPEEREAIVRASTFATLKQGDIIILDDDSNSYPIRINSKVLLEHKGMNVLEFNVK